MTKKHPRPKGEGSVYKTVDAKGNVRWVAQVYVTDPSTSAPKKRTRWLARREDAYAALRAMLDGKDADVGDDTPLTDYLARWLNVHAAGLEPNTVRNYRIFADHLARSSLGAVPLCDLTRLAIDQQFAAWRDAGRSPSWLRMAHAVLHAALERAAADWSLIPANPAHRARLPKADPRRPTLWSDGELARFLESTESDPDGPLWTLLLLAGLRINEALGLCWVDLGWDARTLRVRRQAEQVKGAGVVLKDHPKDRSFRTVVLPARAIGALRAQLGRVAALRGSAGPRWQEHDLVFPTATGTPQGDAAVRARFATRCRSLGLPRLHLHDLRHFHTALLIRSGAHAKVIQERLGHRSWNLTMETYGHLLPGLDAAAAAALDSVIDAIHRV